MTNSEEICIENLCFSQLVETSKQQHLQFPTRRGLPVRPCYHGNLVLAGPFARYSRESPVGCVFIEQEKKKNTEIQHACTHKHITKAESIKPLHFVCVFVRIFVFYVNHTMPPCITRYHTIILKGNSNGLKAHELAEMPLI